VFWERAAVGESGWDGARGAPASWSRAAHLACRAIAFAYYGAAGLTLAFLVLPLQRLAARLAGARTSADLRAQRAIHRASRSFVRLMEGLGLVRVDWRGTEVLAHGPHLVIANHPSLIDTPLLTCCMPQADFVVSPEWSENPYLRRTIAAAGYLRSDRGARVVRDAVERLRAGRSVVIYPEGSRTPPEGLRRFHRGAAHIALAAGCDLLPVLIQVTPRTLMKGQRWNDVPDRLPEWRVEVGEPIHPADLLGGSEGRAGAARRLNAMLQDYFEKRWDRGEC